MFIYYKGCNLLWQPLKYEIYDSVNRVAKQNSEWYNGKNKNICKIDIKTPLRQNIVNLQEWQW